MTEEERRKKLQEFRKPETDTEVDPWTDEEILKAAKRIKEKMGLAEQFENSQSPHDNEDGEKATVLASRGKDRDGQLRSSSGLHPPHCRFIANVSDGK